MFRLHQVHDKIRLTPHSDSDTFPVAEWEEITANELGEIEANIGGLIRVIVAAHRVEEPRHALRDAVIANLRKSIEYRFLVSKSRAQAEIDGWVNVFHSIARVVQKEAGSQLGPDAIVKIYNLEYDWRDTPYVFYQTETSDGQLATVAFRGSEPDQGITSRYIRLPGWAAYSLALAILSDAPHAMTVQAPQFDIVPNIDSVSLSPMVSM